MSRKIKINLAVLFILITSMVILYKYDTRKKKKILVQLSQEFPAISIHKKIQGIITNIYHPYPEIFNDDPLHAYVSLNHSLKISFRTGSELTRQYSLDSILRVGDFILKRESDTLFILKFQESDTLKYIFELRDSLGYPLKKEY